MKKVIWKNTLDNRFLCSVTEDLETCGILEMREVGSEDVVYSRLVPISKYFREQDIIWWGQECLNFLKNNEEYQSPSQETIEAHGQS